MWSEAEYQRVYEKIASYERNMVDMQKRLTAVPALSPDLGGEGEAKKAELLWEMTTSLRPDELRMIKAPDDRVACRYRPSIIARWHGRNKDKTVWIMTHIDIVPPGSLELWDTEPYEVVEKDGKLFGRGVEDNQQSMVASLSAVRAMIECGLQPVFSVGLMLVADEETGSALGAHYLLSESVPRFISPEDILLVPDGGASDGSKIEIAEKSILWLKCTVKGRQAHGSRPDQGNNAHRAGARLLLALDEAFHARYPETDELFEPKGSTFEPTKKEPNVENVNTIPGEDVFYYDCRILPGPGLGEVMRTAREVADRIESEMGVEVSFETPQNQQAAPPTPEGSEVVKRLAAAVKAIRGLDAQPMGIGGGTVAAIFREAGCHAAVWATIDETAHQPNEYCHIKNMIDDAKVFAHLFGQG